MFLNVELRTYALSLVHIAIDQSITVGDSPHSLTPDILLICQRPILKSIIPMLSPLLSPLFLLCRPLSTVHLIRSTPHLLHVFHSCYDNNCLEIITIWNHSISSSKSFPGQGTGELFYWSTFFFLSFFCVYMREGVVLLLLQLNPFLIAFLFPSFSSTSVLLNCAFHLSSPRFLFLFLSFLLHNAWRTSSWWNRCSFHSNDVVKRNGRVLPVAHMVLIFLFPLFLLSLYNVFPSLCLAANLVLDGQGGCTHGST